MPAPGAYQNGAVLDGKVYSIGGDTFDGAALTAYADVLMLDPANLGAGWQTKAPILTPSSGVPGCDESRAFGFDTASGWSLAGKIVLAGCGQWDQTPTTLPDSFVYDGASNTWATFAPLNEARRNHAGAFIVDVRQRPNVGRRRLRSNRHQRRHSHDRNLPVCQGPTAVSLTGFSAAASANPRLPWLALGAALLISVGVLARRKLA